MNKEQAMKNAHEMYLYELSEQTDQKTNEFDDLWQSMYDICQLASYGIIEDVVEEEIQEVKEWLKETQALTQDYQETEIYF